METVTYTTCTTGKLLKLFEDFVLLEYCDNYIMYYYNFVKKF